MGHEIPADHGQSTPCSNSSESQAATTLNHHPEPPPATMEVEQVDPSALSIQQLITFRLFNPHLACERLAEHPALLPPHTSRADIPYARDFVQGELLHHAESLIAMQRIIHGLNKHAGWWQDSDTGEDVRTWPKKFQMLWVMTKLMLVVTEVAEAAEGQRKSLMDDKLPHRAMIEVELADAVIRVFDLAGGLGLDLAGAIMEKLAYNSVREDHTREHRAGEHGKKV